MLLKQSINIKNLKLKNRLVMPPMATAKSDEKGLVSEALCDYYKERAKGGYIGLIITEHSYVSNEGKASNEQLSLSDDNAIEGLKKLTDIIHKDGTKVFAQINHAGSATTEEITGSKIVSASSVVNPGKKVGLPDIIPHSLSIEEIIDIENQFVEAAIRVKDAGFDRVEIHSAHGYLLNQFYSPLTNHRTDKYGINCMENRIRIHVEIIKKIRAVVGEDYPIAIRFGGCDYMKNGSTIEDAVNACKIFEQAGVDLLDISGGMCRYMRKDNNEPGYFKDMTEKIKKAVSIPVILTGGIATIDEAETILNANKADMIGVGRVLLKDAKWASNSMNRVGGR